MGNGGPDGEELEGALDEGGKGLVAEGAEGIGERDGGFGEDNTADDGVLEAGEVVFSAEEGRLAPSFFVEEPALAADAGGGFPELAGGAHRAGDLIPMGEGGEVLSEDGLVGAQEDGEFAVDEGVTDVTEEEGAEVIAGG